MTPRFARVLPVILLVAVIAALATASIASSQIACASCHRAYSAARGHSAHKHVACLSCHGPGLGGRIGFSSLVLGRMLPGRIIGRSPSGPVTEISVNACLGCHGTVEKSVTSGKSGLRINHATCATGVSCDTCHSTVAHGKTTRLPREPVMEDCTACHAAKKAAVTCETCHVKDASIAERLAKGPWQVTHGASWEKTHGMGDLDSCVTCHPSGYCASCHKVAVPHPADFGSKHGGIATKDRSSCLQCHKTEAFCTSCHGMAMPHPAGFLRTHSSVAKSSDDPACLRCHPRQACSGCHVAHVHPGGAIKLPAPTGGSR